jgi:hypothetical protein
MKYKLYISGYIEETQQLLVSFSSDETAREAIDYQSMAFDVVPYGDVTSQEVIDAIAKVAPTVCSDIVVQETYEDNSVKAQSLKNLVGQEFSYEKSDIEEVILVNHFIPGIPTDEGDL